MLTHACMHRLFFGKFTLNGEAQEKDRVIYGLATRYHATHQPSPYNVDAYYTLITATLMLNSNLHAPVCTYVCLYVCRPDPSRYRII